jgi:hypothetical protein
MADNQAQTPQTDTKPPEATVPPPPKQRPADFDGLEGKKPEELTPEELRLMADTMPGDGPGD